MKKADRELAQRLIACIVDDTADGRDPEGNLLRCAALARLLGVPVTVRLPKAA